MRPSKGGYREAGHVDQVVNGYRPRLTPGNLDRILAKGQSSTDLIHTQSTRLWGFRAPSRPAPGGDGQSSARPLPRPERTAARSARGRQPFKYGNVRVANLMDKVLAPTGAPPEGGQARRPRVSWRFEDGCSAPRAPTEGRPGQPSTTHCTDTGGQQEGREGAPPGSSTLTQTSCAGEIADDAHPHPPVGPGWLGGRGGCDRPRCPGELVKVLPGVAIDRPCVFRPVGRGKGETPPAGTGWNVT